MLTPKIIILYMIRCIRLQQLVLSDDQKVKANFGFFLICFSFVKSDFSLGAEDIVAVARAWSGWMATSSRSCHVLLPWCQAVIKSSLTLPIVCQI